MGTNKVASIVLLDVCQSMNNETDNGESYFLRSLNCLKRMILRKMFSQDNDEMGIIIFGADDTDNHLARGSLYQGIRSFLPVNLPTWQMYRDVEGIQLNNKFKSNWIEALVVALDSMKNETQGRRFRSKQIIVFSNCSGNLSTTEESLSPVLEVLEGEKIQFIVVGNDMEEECSQDIPESLQLMFSSVTKLESGVQYSFSEIEKDLEFFEKKRKMGRLLKVNLAIGSRIQLPVRWMKVTSEETRFKWDIPPYHLRSKEVSNQGPSVSIKQEPSIAIKREPSETIEKNDESDITKIEFSTDIVKKTNFGASIIELGYADLEALKRNSGPASFIYIGSIKNTKLPRSMFVGKDVYVVVPDKDARSVSMFSAFVDALIDAKKYGIARRVPVKNGKITIGALLPVSDEQGKALYYMRLPFAEWVKKVPEKTIPDAKNAAGLEAMEDLIDALILPEDLAEEGKGLLVRDPTYQARCHALTLRALGKLPEDSLPDLPQHLMKILNPLERSKPAEDAIERLSNIFLPASDPDPTKPDIAKPPSRVVIQRKELDDILTCVEESFSEDMFPSEKNKE